jgi:cell division protein FtsB
MKRQRSKPHSFEDQLAAEKKRLEERAALLRDGHERKAMLSKIARIDTASHLNELLRSPRSRASDQDPPRRS